jgi:hypothetical protein
MQWWPIGSITKGEPTAPGNGVEDADGNALWNGDKPVELMRSLINDALGRVKGKPKWGHFQVLLLEKEFHGVFMDIQAPQRDELVRELNTTWSAIDNAYLDELGRRMLGFS